MSILENITLLKQSKEKLRIGLGLDEAVPFNEYVNNIAYNPLELFKGGKQGVWYDPSDKSTLFQDVAGRVPVTKDGDPVALILDKSQGLALGANLFNDGHPMTSNSGWLVGGTSWDSTLKAVVIDQAGYSIYARYPVTGLTAGKTYKLSVDVVKDTQGSTGGSHYFGIYETSNNSSDIVSSTFPRNTVQTLSLIFTARATNQVRISKGGISGELAFNNVRIQELAGNHATQTVSAARPVYKTDGILHWLEFDGVDDSFTLNFNTPVNPENSIYMGVNAEKLGVYPFLLTQKINYGLINWLLAPSQNLLTIAQIGTKKVSAFTFGSVNVISVDSGSTLTVRNNGVQTATAPASKVLLTNLFIGSQFGTGNYAKFKLYGMLVFEGGVYNSDADVYLANKSGVTL